MIPLLIVADGPRDEATLPSLVETILGKVVRPHFVRWARLQSPPGKGTGYGRKLKFAVRQAKREELSGLVAVVDRDRDRSRLNDLREGRSEDREKGLGFPTAVGCAVPHTEKWFVSDRAALRQCFRRGSEAEFDSLQSSGQPKDDLDHLFAAHEVAKIDGLRTLAASMQVSRCVSRAESGLADFERELITEIGQL